MMTLNLHTHCRRVPDATTARTVGILVLVVVLVVVGAGCFDAEPDRIRAKDHIVVLHPPMYEWNEEDKELTGEFLLSNIHEEESEDHVAEMKWFSLDVVFANEEESLSWGMEWGAREPVEIAPGETVGFNFSFPRDNMWGDQPVERIHVSLNPRYTYCCNASRASEGNPEGITYVRQSYENGCLRVRDGEVVMRRPPVDSEEGCNPWQMADWQYTGSNLGYTLLIGDEYYPPPELWDEWDEESRIPLSEEHVLWDAVQFLEGFDRSEVDVRYFEGEVHG